MKLAYCIHSLWNSGGVERVLTDKANYLAEVYGYDVTIITAKQDGRPNYFHLSPLVHTVDVGINYYSRIRLPRFLRRLDGILCELRPDICISLSNYDIYGLASMHDGSVKIAEYHFNHDRWLMEKGRWSLKARIRICRLEHCAAAMDKFVVLTQSDAEDWRRVVPDVAQIYNPCPYEPFRSPLGSKEFIATGRLAKQKDFASLVRIWKLVDARHPDWTLRIYGDGPLRAELEAQIGNLGLKGKVILEKPVKNIVEKMRGSAGLLMTSIYEGFGMVLAEAASQGLPLVATDCKCGPSEIVYDGRNGYLVQIGDENRFADSVCALIEDPELRKKMGAASLEVAEKFKKPVVLAQWHELFQTFGRA